MSGKGYIGVGEFGTVDDLFDNVDWQASMDVNYNHPTNQTTYKTRGTTAVHIIHQRQRSQAYTRVYIVPEDTKGNGTGPDVEVRCKSDTDTGAIHMSIPVFRMLFPAMFDST